MFHKKTTQDTTEYQPSRALTACFEWVSAAIVALVVIVLLFAMVFRMVNVDGESMMTTLHNGDRLLISGFSYTPDYGDIVIIRRDNDTPLIKRVIGLPGDTISIDNESGTVYRNGEKLTEPYALGNTRSYITEVVVPEDHLYVLGDNRENSLDSRILGCQSMDHLVGRVLFRLTPNFGKVE